MKLHENFASVEIEANTKISLTHSKQQATHPTYSSDQLKILTSYLIELPYWSKFNIFHSRVIQPRAYSNKGGQTQGGDW